MGRSRAALTGALIGAMISGALIGLARGGERVECFEADEAVKGLNQAMRSGG